MPPYKPLQAMKRNTNLRMSFDAFFFPFLFHITDGFIITEGIKIFKFFSFLPSWILKEVVYNIHTQKWVLYCSNWNTKSVLKAGSQHCLHTFNKTSSSWTLDALSDFENLTFFLLPFFYKDDTAMLRNLTHATSWKKLTFFTFCTFVLLTSCCFDSSFRVSSRNIFKC
jgi:hypothetical protein